MIIIKTEISVQALESVWVCTRLTCVRECSPPTLLIPERSARWNLEKRKETKKEGNKVGGKKTQLNKKCDFHVHQST